MSFCKHKTVAEEGDTALVYLTPKLMYPLKLKAAEVFQTRFGALKHDDVIGRRYGCKVATSKGGFVHVLDMTPELWTVTLPHRTQILYNTDISFILLQLQLKPGSVVLEAGTGSGSLSHCIARTIAPSGHLFTHDFHQERALTAAAEFKEHGLEEIVTVQHRDVCQDGFDVPKPADGVFLDLPHPWEAIESANAALKNGGRICCFSPCIEQVQRSAQTLTDLNFMDIETYELVLRPYEVRDIKLKKYTFDPNRGTTTPNAALNNNRRKQAKAPENEDGDLMDTTDADEVNGGTGEEENDEQENVDCDDSVEEGNSGRKRIKLEDGKEAQTAPAATADSAVSPDDSKAKYTTAYMNNEVAGHTGFLIFATKFESDAPSAS